MIDKGIKRGAGLTWRLEDSGPFEKQRLRVQVPTMWLWPSVMQISPLLVSVSVWFTAWRPYISFPCEIFNACRPTCVCLCVCACFWVYWHKHAAEISWDTLLLSVSSSIWTCDRRLQLQCLLVCAVCSFLPVFCCSVFHVHLGVLGTVYKLLTCSG